MQNYKTICPDCILLKTWECKKELEQAIICQAITKEDKRVSKEVFEVENIELLTEKLDNIFKMLIN